MLTSTTTVSKWRSRFIIAATMIRILSRQLLIFLLVGFAQLALDSALFVALTATGLPVALGNIAGRLAGASLGYWLNGRYPFADQGRPRLGRIQLRRFVIAWSALTVLSTLLLSAIALHAPLAMVWLAKPGVEALMAAIGFVVWRQWVYR